MPKPSVPLSGLIVSRARAMPINNPSEPELNNADPPITQQDVVFLDRSPQVHSIYGGDESTYVTSETGAANSTNWSTSLQTVLDQPPSALPHRLLLGGIIFFLAFGAWAWLGQIEEVGHAQGQLVAKGDNYKVHPVDSGKIATIAVKEGQEVRAGQVLVKLDTTIAANEVERLQQQLAADQGELGELQALIDKNRLEARSHAAVSSASVQAQTAAIAQAKVNAATTQAFLSQLRADATAQQARMQRLQPLVQQGAIAKDRLFEEEQALRERQRSIIQSQGEMQQSLAESLRLQSELAQKQAEGQTTQLQVAQQTQQLEVQRNQLKAKIAENRTLLASTKAKLKQNFLTAPVDGVIMALNVPNPGEVVQPGQNIAEIAPHSAPLVLSAVLPNQEAGFTKVGMPVQVKLDAYPYQEYGIVPGTVASISPSTKPDQRLGAVYKVEVLLARNNIKTHNQMIKFKAGQTATAEIVIRRRRIVDILLDPFKQLQKGGINL